MKFTMHAWNSGPMIQRPRGGQDAFTIIEVMVAAGLGAILLWGATSMLSTSIERVHKLQEKELDAKLTGAFALNFKRMARRSAVSAHFWYQSVDLTSSCLDPDVVGGCGFVLRDNPKYDSKADPDDPESERKCIEAVPDGLAQGSSPIQLFANKSTEFSEVEHHFDENGTDSITMESYLPVEGIDDLENVYAAWKITANTPLSMLTRPHHRRLFFKVPNELRGPTNNLGDRERIEDNNVDLSDVIVLQGSQLADDTFPDNEAIKQKKLKGSVMVVYAAAVPSMFALLVIDNVWKVGTDAPDNLDLQVGSAVERMFNGSANVEVNEAIQGLISTIQTRSDGQPYFVMRLSLLSFSQLRQFFSSEEDGSLNEGVLQQIRNIRQFINSSESFNIDQKSEFQGAWQILEDETPWNNKIHILDRFIQSQRDQLVFLPVELINLSLKSRAWNEPGIVFVDSDGNEQPDCDGCEVRSLMRRPFRLNPNNTERPLELTARPILSSIHPKVKDDVKDGEKAKKQKRAYNKDVLLARKIQGSSMVSIVENLQDLKCPDEET